MRAGIAVGGWRGWFAPVAGQGRPGIQGRDGLRLPARPPNWRVSGRRRPAQTRRQARSAKLAVRRDPFEFPIRGAE